MESFTVINIVLVMIIIIIQGILLFKLKKYEESKYWNLFLGIWILTLTYIPFIFLFIPFLVFLFLFSANIAMLVIGLIIKNKLSNKNIKINKINIGLIIAIISIILISGSILFIPGVIDDITAPIKPIKYLTKKYGDNNFRLKSKKKEYHYSTFVDREFVGYNELISSNLFKDSFKVKTDDSGKVTYENFLETYYKYRINKYLEEKYNLKNVDIRISIDEDRIPDNYGRVLTYNELLDYDAVSGVGGTYLYAYYITNSTKKQKDTKNSHIGKKDIIKVAPDLIKLLKVSKNRDVPVFIIDKYEISRISGTLMIYDMNKDKWIYELDMNN